MTNLEHLLSEVKSIYSKYEHIVRVTGANFNIFKILDVQSNEVKHSAFLAELLNVQGSHGQGSIYLDLFLSQLKVEDFDSKTSNVFVEYRIGEVDNGKKEGGNIDILLQDKENRNIIIENKIYAGDQPLQLKRYHNFLIKQNGGKLFYLNLFGDEPSKDSLDDLIENTDYYIISYQTDILQWLEKCLKESVDLPKIRETVQQYITLIKNLTNQSSNNTMDNEIINFIAKSSDNMETAHRIVKCFDGAKQIILQNFWKTLSSTFEKEGIRLKQQNYIKGTKEIISLRVELEEKYKGYQLCWCAEIEDSFYTGFRIFNKENSKVNEDEFNDIINYLKERNYTFEYSWLGWKYSNPRLNFKEFNTSDIFALANQNKLKEIVDRMVDDAQKEIVAIRQNVL
jgi:hypothetical protein